jgi:cellobiose-specific phosphotransferase system component IIA
VEKNNSSMEKDISCIVKQIHASPYMILLSITGGGTGAIGEMLKHGNGSATLIEAIVPYHENALQDFIGKEPERYCSEETAREMAMAAFKRALEIAGSVKGSKADYLIGVGATCKLAKESERDTREHEIHIASQSISGTNTTSLTLLQDRSREEEEELASTLLIHAVARLCGAGPVSLDEHISMTEQQILQKKEAAVSYDVGELLLSILLKKDSYGKKCITIAHGQKTVPAAPGIIFSGSFNPCHKNHVAMAKIAYERYGSQVTFEISLANVDKPPTDFISLESRINSLKTYANEGFFGNICLTNAPLFADKVLLFPGSRFLIGSDTMNRIFNEKYYREGENRVALIEHFKKHNVSFLVFHRQDVEIGELGIDKDVLEICEIMPHDTYTDDGTSSTKLRKACAK